MANLYLISGDDYADSRRLLITVADPDGVAVDLTATDLTFMVKVNRGDLDVDAVITKATPVEIELASPQTGETKGKAYITLDAADTATLDGRYRWELEAEDADGVMTLASGVLFVTADLITA